MSRKQRPAGGLMLHVLGTIRECGAADAAEVSRNLLVDGRRLGPILRGLELRGWVERTYTGHSFGSGHAYVCTAAGEKAVLAEFGDDE